MEPIKNTAKTLIKFLREMATVIALMPTASKNPLIYAKGFLNTFRLFFETRSMTKTEPIAKRAEAMK